MNKMESYIKKAAIYLTILSTLVTPSGGNSANASVAEDTFYTVTPNNKAKME